MTNSVDDLLIEIGTEELPPKSLSKMMRSFGRNFGQLLDDAEFAYESLSTFATPRRLAVLVRDLADSQTSHTIEKRGPSLKVAYDESGKPSKAALGFMRSCDVDDIGQLGELKTDKGAWLVYQEHTEGEQLENLISDLISRSLANLPIERKMRWGSTRVEFVRPVHWMVVLYGNRVLPVELLNVAAGNLTYGHRFMSPAAITLEQPDDYIQSLMRGHVIVDFETRKQLITDQVKLIGQDLGSTVVVDEDLLDEVAALVEWPVALTGNFDQGFLKLPEEVLISAMKSHQRYFHVVDSKGQLEPRFVTVANIESTNPATVIRGNERVISPRLSDAEFFFRKDKNTSLEDKLARLADVVFQSKLGSYRDKAIRVSHLAGYIAERTGADVTHAKRAGLLCKADLVSDMVTEFPELQGIMGSYYADYDGESDEVIRAIRDHYKPNVSGGVLPESRVGNCVSIADKADSLVGLFGIGQTPSGSRDPFALRRQALGILRICIENGLPLKIRELIDEAINIHQQPFNGDVVVEFLLERLGTLYQDLGVSHDTFEAVRQSDNGIDNLAEADLRIRSLQEFRDHDRADNLIAANKRISNILKKIDPASLAAVNPGLFEVEAEKCLYTALNNTILQLDRFSQDQPVNNELKFLALADLQSDIDQYFDDVMVMSDNQSLKLNRLATLHQVRSLFLSVADFALLQ